MSFSGARACGRPGRAGTHGCDPASEGEAAVRVRGQSAPAQVVSDQRSEALLSRIRALPPGAAGTSRRFDRRSTCPGPPTPVLVRFPSLHAGAAVGSESRFWCAGVLKLLRAACLP